MTEETNAASPAADMANPSTEPAQAVSENKPADATMDEGQAEAAVEGKSVTTRSLLPVLNTSVSCAEKLIHI